MQSFYLFIYFLSLPNCTQIKQGIKLFKTDLLSYLDNNVTLD
jgi:hypothetical protein